MTRRNLFALALVGALALVADTPSAHADIGRKVIAAFKGQLLVSTDRLEPEGTDKATIEAFKKARVKAIKGEANSDEVHSWFFHYTAFLKSTGATNLKLEFWRGNKYVADQRLEGVDAKDPVLQGTIGISEDDGPAKGVTYTLKMVAVRGSKETVVSTSTLTLN
jgi:hypothetical protein